MSQETVETMTKVWMERVWNQQDNAAFDELMSDEFVSHGFRTSDKPGWRSFHAVLRAAYSDIHITVEDQIVSGDKVASRWTGTMVHRATVSPVTFSGMTILRVRNGQIVESWNSVDYLPMLKTLNLIPGDVIEKAFPPAQMDKGIFD